MERFTVRALIGKPAYTLENMPVGRLREIVLDMASRRVAYAVLDFSGSEGMDSRLFALPWECLRYDARLRRLDMGVGAGKLAQAPSFAPGHWPDMATPEFSNEIHGYYGTLPVPGQLGGCGSKDWPKRIKS